MWIEEDSFFGTIRSGGLGSPRGLTGSGRTAATAARAAKPFTASSRREVVASTCAGGKGKVRVRLGSSVATRAALSALDCVLYKGRSLTWRSSAEALTTTAARARERDWRTAATRAGAMDTEEAAIAAMVLEADGWVRSAAGYFATSLAIRIFHQ